MRKLLIGIFALGLVIAFAAPASALDIKVSGEYKVEGWMIDNQRLDSAGTNDEFYTQRLRVATTFAVSPRLMVNTRFDVMEGVWGGHKTVYGENGYSHYGYHHGYEEGSTTAFNRDMDTNIQFDLVNMRFITKCGIFDVGYQTDGLFGTTFGDTEYDVPKISWIYPRGKFTSIFQIKKYTEGDWSGLDRRDVPSPLYGSNLRSDADEDRYMWIGMYTEKNWQAGLLLQYHRAAQESMGMSAFAGTGLEGYFANKKNLFLVTPYFKGTFGNLYLEGQIYWFADGELEWQDNSALAIGNRTAYDPGWAGDLDMEGFTAYVMGKYNIGAGYAGALFAYAQGDDPYEKDTLGGLLNGGEEWNPMLILWNKDLVKWGGRMGGVKDYTTGKAMENAFLVQVFGGYKVNEKLDLFGAFAWAQADETLNYVDDEIGYELDVKATYKIFDNLDYEVAFGYFWAGDWYKGKVSPGTTGYDIDDNYLLFHKLSLKF